MRKVISHGWRNDRVHDKRGQWPVQDPSRKLAGPVRPGRKTCPNRPARIRTGTRSSGLRAQESELSAPRSGLRSRGNAARANARGARPPSDPCHAARCRPVRPSAPAGARPHARRSPGLPDRRRWAGRRGPVREPDDLPATGRGESLTVFRAQVVAVGLGIRGERTEDRGRIGIDVRQCRDSGTAARGARTATYRAHDVGRYRTLERAATTLPTSPHRVVTPRSPHPAPTQLP